MYMQSERSQSQKATYYIIPFIWYSGKVKLEGQTKDQRLQEVKGGEGFDQKGVAWGNFREQGARKPFGNLIMVVFTWLGICENL